MFKLVKQEVWRIQCCASGQYPDGISWELAGDASDRGYLVTSADFPSKAAAEAVAEQCRQNYKPPHSWPHFLYINIVQEEDRYCLYVSKAGYEALENSDAIEFRHCGPFNAPAHDGRWRFQRMNSFTDGWCKYEMYKERPDKLLEFLRTLYPAGEQWIVPLSSQESK